MVYGNGELDMTGVSRTVDLSETACCASEVAVSISSSKYALGLLTVNLPRTLKLDRTDHLERGL